MNSELTTVIINKHDTLTTTQHAIAAYFYECKFIALGYSLIGLIFVLITIVSGFFYLKYKKKQINNEMGDMQGLCLMGMIVFFILSTAMLVVSVYKYALYQVAEKTPIGAYQLEYGDNTRSNTQKIMIDIPSYVSKKDTTK